MNRVIAILALLLAAGILYELHGINSRLDGAALLAPWGSTKLPSEVRRTETADERTKRLEAEAADLRRWQADYQYLTEHSQPSNAGQRTSRR